MKLAKLFEPGAIGNMTVPNRIVMPGIGTHSGDADGQINQRTIDYYEARARGGVGLIITQGMGFFNTGYPHRIMLNDDRFVPGLKRLTESIHAFGTKIVCQLSHVGAGGARFWEGHKNPETEVLGPSAVQSAIPSQTPRAMTVAEIHEYVEKWSDAAARAREAGFDGVEIQGAHGYFLSAFLSRYQNRRTDQYGDSLENRARFSCEVLSRTRRKVGQDFPILFRYNGCDFFEGGITLDEATLFAPLFVEAGADALDISAGNQEGRQWRDLTYLFPDGAIVHTSESIKKVVKVPVITVGKIGDLDLAESIISQGKADFVAIGRALLADPELPNKSREGRDDDIRRCIYCNNCRIGHGKKFLMDKKGAGLACTVNPALLREQEFQTRPAAKAKKVMVVGGGLAGMEAAAVLRERGHAVSLYEKTDRLGGLWNIVVQDPHKSKFSTVTEHLSRRLTTLDVPVILQTTVTPELVRREQPDAVVVATGAAPRRLDIPGATGPNVIQATSVLSGEARAGQRVVVVGGRLLGMEVALLLAEQGKQVSLLTRSALGGNAERNIFVVLRQKLMELKVPVYTNSPVLEITENGLYFAWGTDKEFLAADSIVLAVGLEPEGKLEEELKGIVPEIHAVGDCVEPRNALDAINEGAEIAYGI